MAWHRRRSLPVYTAAAGAWLHRGARTGMSQALISFSAVRLSPTQLVSDGLLRVCLSAAVVVNCSGWRVRAHWRRLCTVCEVR